MIRDMRVLRPSRSSFISPLRHGRTGLIWLLLLITPTLAAEVEVLTPLTGADLVTDSQPPLIVGAWITPDEGTRVRWNVTAGLDALNMGMPAIAEKLFRTALEQSERLEAAEVDLIARHLVDALISQGRFSEARRVLLNEAKEGSPGYALRAALLARHHQENWRATTILSRLNPDQLNLADRYWFFLLRGLLLEENERFEQARNAYLNAEAISPNPLLRAEAAAAVFRTQLMQGEANETLARQLQDKMTSHRGTRAGTQFAKEYAILLERLGRRQEAIEVVREQLLLETHADERDNLLLLLAILQGTNSESGRDALREIIRRPGDRAAQETALSLLLASWRQSTDINRFKQDLDTLIVEQSEHPLLDRLYLWRAQLALSLNQPADAEIYAKRLLDAFPGSPLKNDAIRLLAFAAWQPGSDNTGPRWRTAADYLNQLRQNLPEGLERLQAGILMADCYFRNGDYSNAADVYGSLLDQTADPRIRGELLFQRVVSLLRANNREAARQQLDAVKQAEVEIDPGFEWQAEWVLINAMRRDGENQEAFRRIRRLLADAEDTPLSPALRARLLWLEAQLSAEAGDATATPALADGILAHLEALPEGAMKQDQIDLIASQALLLKGQALLNNDLPDQALRIFVQLNERFPNSQPAILSYLVEARFHAARGQTVEAQRRLRELADRYPKSEYAPLALFEAAKQAEARGLDTSVEESAAILRRLVEDYPNHALVFYARMHQGDLARKLNRIPEALAIYENILTRWPDHPERYRVELARADSLLAQASRDNQHYDNAAALFEKLFALDTLPADIRIEAGYKWGYALEKQNRPGTAMEVYWLTVNRFLRPEADASATLNAQGRYWMARTLLTLGQLAESQNQPHEATRVYQLILDYQLPGQATASNHLKRLNPPQS